MGEVDGGGALGFQSSGPPFFNFPYQISSLPPCLVSVPIYRSIRVCLTFSHQPCIINEFGSFLLFLGVTSSEKVKGYRNYLSIL